MVAPDPPRADGPRSDADLELVDHVIIDGDNLLHAVRGSRDAGGVAWLLPRLRAWLPSAPLAAAVHLLVMFGASFALAFASWHLFEKHFLHLKDVLAPRRDPRPETRRPHVAPVPSREEAPALP